MTIFDFLNLLGGLCLFLFGMNLMGEALERRAGSRLSVLIGKLTSNRWMSFLTGLGVTAVIQSSSATTVMAVGFVNSGVMTLRQSIGIIMGANIGTTVTAWILSLGGIESSNMIVQLLRPSSFTPVLALIGVVFYLFCRGNQKKDTGVILLGFAVLMFGMDHMSASVAGLRDVPQFRQMFLLFTNPVLGVLAGALVTAVIQSSSASVGILQALTVTGQISYGAALPIIMGQNIGTCVTALLSSFGANRSAKRVALVHLCFNLIGTAVLLAVLCLAQAVLTLPVLEESASHLGIAVAHSLFNILCTALLFPFSGALEALVCRLVPDARTAEQPICPDERLLSSPALALESARQCTAEMARCTCLTLTESTGLLTAFHPEAAERIRAAEAQTDHFENLLGSYLVKLSSRPIDEAESAASAQLLRIIGDLERIADHGCSILDAMEEQQEKQIVFTDSARREIGLMVQAVREITRLSVTAFLEHDPGLAADVAPLEEVIDRMKDLLRRHHIARLQQGSCTIDAGFIWSDLLTDLERISDHCLSIADCVLELPGHLPDSGCGSRADRPRFRESYAAYSEKYLSPLAGNARE